MLREHVGSPEKIRFKGDWPGIEKGSIVTPIDEFVIGEKVAYYTVKDNAGNIIPVLPDEDGKNCY